VFTTIEDRRGRTIISVRDQNNHVSHLRQKRLMTLLHLFVIHRYGASSVHFVTPSEDNRRQCARMREIGIFSAVNDEIGEIIVADVDAAFVASLVVPDSSELAALIGGP
jgi:isocitrate lyase